jgi:hypothetical protein
VAKGLVVCTIAVWPAINMSMSAQQPSTAQADAAALARRTLAARLSLPIDRIQIVSVTPASWRDSSLGCPERGSVYTPVLRSGYRVRLQDSEREHIVHVAGGNAVICSSQADPKLSPKPIISASLDAADRVRTVLAARLGIEPTRVRIVSTRPARSDSRPCSGAPTESAGTAHIVDAVAEAQTFRYYTDDAVTVMCEVAPQKKG